MTRPATSARARFWPRAADIPKDLEAATVGAAYPNPDGRAPDVSRDFVAQGAANMVGGFFRTTVVAGSLSRTGWNVSGGARSPMVGRLRRAAADHPRGGRRQSGGATSRSCTLAAILIVIGFDTLLKEVRHLLEARFISWPHLVAAGITVLVGVFYELTAAIFTGVALSLILYTLTMANRGKLDRARPGSRRESGARWTRPSGSSRARSPCSGMSGSRISHRSYRATTRSFAGLPGRPPARASCSRCATDGSTRSPGWTGSRTLITRCASTATSSCWPTSNWTSGDDGENRTHRRWSAPTTSSGGRRHRGCDGRGGEAGDGAGHPCRVMCGRHGQLRDQVRPQRRCWSPRDR